MNLMTLENISKSYSEKILLKDISFGINEYSTLTLLAFMIVPLSGTSAPAIIFKRVDLPVPLTPIIPIFSPSLIPNEISLSNQETLDTLSKDYNDNLNSKLISLQEKIDALNLWDLESEAKTVLTKLGIIYPYQVL